MIFAGKIIPVKSLVSCIEDLEDAGKLKNWYCSIQRQGNKCFICIRIERADCDDVFDYKVSIDEIFRYAVNNSFQTVFINEEEMKSFMISSPFPAPIEIDIEGLKKALEDLEGGLL